MNLEVVSTAGVEPVTLAEAKAQLNIDSADTTWDTIINSLIPVVREVAESETQRDLKVTTYKLSLDGFRKIIVLPRNPLIEVVSITYTDDSDVEQTLSTDDYQVVIGDKGRVYIDTEVSPKTAHDAVKITFKAGYATAAEVPRKTWQGMQFTLSHFFENRSSVVEGRVSHEVPFTAQWLFHKDKVY